MKKIQYFIMSMSLGIFALCDIGFSQSSTYYADLIANYSIINKQSSVEGYRLNNTLTRAELAKIASNLGGMTVKKCTGTIFIDVKSNIGDLCGFIETLADAKVVTTSSKYYRPNDTVTRAEAIKILLGVIGEGKSNINAGYMDANNLGDLEGYINKAREIGSIADTKYIYPNSPILRHEVFILAAFYAGIDTSNPAFAISTRQEDTRKSNVGEKTSLTGASVIAPKTLTKEKLTINESSYMRISEEFNFKVYEADVTATDGDIILEKIDLVQFGSGEGINIGELYKRDYNGNMLKLSTSKDERVYKFYKREGNPGISFDLFTGLEPGMKIRNGETVKFTITIDSMSFSEYGKDFQKTNIFYVKYIIKGKEGYYDSSLSRGIYYNKAEDSYAISGSTPQIIVYRACDEGVKITTDSTPIVFDENFNMNLFSTGKVSDRSLDGLAMPIQYYYTRNLESDLNAYQNDIREKFIDSSITYTTWLNKKYIAGLVDAYQNKQKPWLFVGYKSKINTQFRPSNGMQCKDISDVAKTERIAFKITYDDIVSSFNQDKINQLTDRVTELEALNAGCTIKGNVNFDTGEKIYHIPGSRFYAETIINTLYGERWFCSESDAVKAGWRKEQGY